MCLNAFIQESDCIRMLELEEADAKKYFYIMFFPISMLEVISSIHALFHTMVNGIITTKVMVPSITISSTRGGIGMYWL